MTEPVPLYPLFLKLEGERCVVVGAGKMAAHKAAELARCGAAVTLVGEEPAAAAEALAAEPPAPGTVEIEARSFEAGDVKGARIVIAATDDEETNRAVAEAARRARALVNVVDVVPLCDFYTGGVVRRGPLTVVVGTNGASPSLARRTRLWLEDALPEGLGRLGAALGRARPRLLERYPTFKRRAKVLDHFVRERFEQILAGDDGARASRWVEADLLEGDDGRSGHMTGPQLVKLAADFGDDDDDEGRLVSIVLADDAFEGGEVELAELTRADRAWVLDRARALMLALCGGTPRGPTVVERVQSGFSVDGARVADLSTAGLSAADQAASEIVDATYALVKL